MEPEVTESGSTFRSKFDAAPTNSFEKRGKEDGHDIDDWVQAESELTAATTKAAA
jgi:Protein of unknown function (DUF2934)